MPRQTLARFSRYNKRILFGSVTVLSIVIAVAIVLSGIDAFTQYRDQQIALFSGKRQTVALEVNRLSARLMQFADLLESRWHMDGQSTPPLERYRKVLTAGNGAAISGHGLTSMPFSIVTTLTRPDDSQRLSVMLQIIREMSILSDLDAQRPGITLSAEVFSPDGTFAAAVPPLPDTDLADARRIGAKRFIAARMALVNSLLVGKSVAQMRAQRLLWASQSGTVDTQGASTAAPAVQIVLPIFYSHEHLATIALSMPADQFQQYLMRGPPASRFILFDASASEVLGDSQIDIGRHLLQTLLASRPQLASATPDMKVQYHDGTFFITQRLPGPEWITVSAFGWLDVLDSQRKRYLTAMLLYLAVMLSLWIFALYFNRYVATPLQRRVQKAIEVEQFNQSIVDTLPIGIMVYALPSGEVLLENAIATSMLDSARPGASQRFYNRLMQERHEAEIASNDGPTHTFVEIDWAISGDRTTYLGVASSHTRFLGRNVILLGLVDINERKANEMLLTRAKQTADRENRAKSAFLAIMSHEVRTPLHGAIGNLELLAHASLAAEQRERVGTIQRTLNNLLSLANDILDVTSIEANTLKISVAPMRINEIVEHCAQTFAPNIVGRHVELYCLSDPALDMQVEGDEKRLTQVLQNLVGNAAKFTQEGSIALSVKLLREEAQQAWVRFEVADTGIGIPAELHTAIFEPLTQADDTIGRRFGGSGLGLFLCRNLVGLMGGRVRLASEAGKGSVFRVELPFKVLETASRTRPLANMSVDIACDQPAWRDMLAKRVQAWGATVYERSDAGTRPAMRLVAKVQDPRHAMTSAGELAPPPILGTIRTAPDCPLTPQRNGDRIDVTSLSSRALLAALSALTGTTKLSPSEPPEPAATRKSNLTTSAPENTALDLLVVEDDPVSRTLIEHQLATLGYTRVRIAHDGREALNEWRKQPPDITFADLHIPYLDGIELLGEIRKLDATAIVIATTALAESDIDTDAVDFSTTLHKPISLDDLRRALDDVQRAIRQRVPSTQQDDVQHRHADPLHLALGGAFVESCNAVRPELAQALQTRDRQSLRRHLHRLQGSLSIMGYDDAARECASLQTLCEQGDWAILEERCNALIVELKRLVDESSFL